jgi:dolichol-phosphate mannosyltransferase
MWQSEIRWSARSRWNRIVLHGPPVSGNHFLTAPSTAAGFRPALSIIIPTYNERTRITELIETLLRVFAAHGLDGELVIVDDRSPDGTGAIVDRLVAAHAPRLQAIHRGGKLGLGTAVIEGFLAARAPVVGVMDADFSHPPEHVPRMFAVLEGSGVDAVIGSRYIPGGAAKNWPVSRLLLSRFACVLAWPLTPVRDATSGFFLIRREVVQGVQIAAGGFKICLELLIRSPVRSVAEVPYVFVDRTTGQSKMSVREALGYFTQLRQLYRVWFGAGRPYPRYVRHS